MEILPQSNYNSATGSDLYAQLTTVNNRINAVNAELTNAKTKYAWCMDNRLKSCKNNTGSSKDQWREFIGRKETELARLKIEQKELQVQYDTSLTTAQKQKIVEQAEHETEILEQKEWAERAKKLGMYAGIAGGLALVGVIIFKKLKS